MNMLTSRGCVGVSLILNFVLRVFKSTYFEEHLRTAASENVFMKLRKIKIYHKEFVFFQDQYQKQVHDWYFMIGFP